MSIRYLPSSALEGMVTSYEQVVAICAENRWKLIHQREQDPAGYLGPKHTRVTARNANKFNPANEVLEILSGDPLSPHKTYSAKSHFIVRTPQGKEIHIQFSMDGSLTGVSVLAPGGLDYFGLLPTLNIDTATWDPRYRDVLTAMFDHSHLDS